MGGNPSKLYLDMKKSSDFFQIARNVGNFLESKG